MKLFQNLGILNDTYLFYFILYFSLKNLKNIFRSSTEDEEEDGSICSCNAQRNDGAAFPKAFDRDLVTPSPMNRSNDALVSYLNNFCLLLKLSLNIFLF